jgi:hypothetical protein
VSVSPLISIVTEIVTIPGRVVTPKTAALSPHPLPRCKMQVFKRIDDCDHLFGIRRISITLAQRFDFLAEQG